MRFAPVCALLLLASCQGTGGRDAVSAPTPAAIARAEPRFVGALEALQEALRSNEDEAAQAILNRIWSLGPDQATAELLRVFERVLNGRATVRALALELLVDPLPLPRELEERLPGASGHALTLEIRNPLSSALVLQPGPATLGSVREELTNGGAIVRSEDLRPFALPRSIELPPQGRVELPLAEFFLAPRPSERAVRLRFALELRSGTLLCEGQELPAMRWVVAPVSACTRTERLRDALEPGELMALLRTDTDERGLLDAAARIAEDQRAAALRRLCQALDPATRVDLARFHKALSWLAGESLPEDPVRLQEWIRARRPQPPRPSLVLPSESGP
jgi:hypothetical protein